MQSLSRKQMKMLDATAFASGFSTIQLMESAGIEIAGILSQKYSSETTFLFMCGSGNNGGDGLVACRQLVNKGYQASVLLSSEKLSEAAKHNLKLVEHMGVPINVWKKNFEFSPYDVLVDCLLGYSQKGELRDPLTFLVPKARNANKRIIAVDIPTGLDATTGKLADMYLPADLTISLAAPKKGFDKKPDVCGEILVVGIGIPAFVYKHLGLEDFLVEGVKTYSVR